MPTHGQIQKVSSASICITWNTAVSKVSSGEIRTRIAVNHIVKVSEFSDHLVISLSSGETISITQDASHSTIPAISEVAYPHKGGTAITPADNTELMQAILNLAGLS